MAHSLERNWRSGILPVTLAVTVGVAPVHGQGALNPTVAPRAAELARNGQRGVATEMLGRYLATATDDGSAWIQLGRFYLLDIRDWHAAGHSEESPGPLYLDFAAAAVDQAVRLRADSGLVLRHMLELERGIVAIEEAGWAALANRPVPRDLPPLPDFILELGANLLSSCPPEGVVATGSDIEAVAVWAVAGGRSGGPLLIPSLYATDARYRRRMATVLGTDAEWPVQQALGAVAAKRPVCLTPHADRALLALPDLRPMRFVLVTGPGVSASDRVVTVTGLLRAERQGASPWTSEVHGVYRAAAGFNPRLCDGPLALLGDTQSGTCHH
jgi:hypothetical protein